VNTLKLQIRMKHSEGALMRMLSVTRRRRFEVLHLIAVATEDGAFLKVQMTVQAERKAHTLVGQLTKLEEVFEVEILEPNNSECGAGVPSPEPDGFPPIALD
jgi:acetolactate synthase regulatory subunit